jgi:hypothetical protein
VPIKVVIETGDKYASRHAKQDAYVAIRLCRDSHCRKCKKIIVTRADKCVALPKGHWSRDSRGYHVPSYNNWQDWNSNWKDNWDWYPTWDNQWDRNSQYAWSPSWGQQSWNQQGNVSGGLSRAPCTRTADCALTLHLPARSGTTASTTSSSGTRTASVTCG